MQNNTPSSEPNHTSEPTLTANTPAAANKQSTPEAWEEFLEEDADCCGGCHHKPR